ncbi:hypothetical protein Pmani_013076 [Petrolisthes manimaculis]|uniref:Uncharacterized protein n=1 Tax=Petrolisthes manimaculis TaxID=1843537 RepID=A0AAE1U9P5_9EUCA|nr:hypothetical protein Pmani_013076 [Petrolisthes manimaculis]
MVKETCVHFWRCTSLAGLSHANNTTSHISRAFWLILFGIGAVLTVKDVISLIQSYESRPYTTKIDYTPNLQMEFPDVVICNQNRLSCYKLLEFMLKEMSARDSSSSSDDESDYYKDLVNFYLISGCGDKGLKCDKVTRESYYRHYSQTNESIPAVLMEKDKCLECKPISEAYEKFCSGLDMGEESQVDPELDFLWQNLNCYEKLRQDAIMEVGSDGGGGDDKVSKIPMSLATCQLSFLSQGGPPMERDSPTVSRATSTNNSVTVVSSTVASSTVNRGIVTLSDRPVLSVGVSGSSVSTSDDVSPGPVSLLPNPISSTTGPVSSTTGPVSSTDGPVSSTTGPVSSTTGPVSSTTGPVSSTTGPVSSTTGPVSSTDGPTVTSSTSASPSTPNNPELTTNDRDRGAIREQQQEAPSEVLNRRKRSFMDRPGQDPGPDDDTPRKMPKAMNPSERSDLKMDVLSRYMALSFPLRKALGYSFNELILDCVFMGFNCTDSSFFTYLLHPRYGNCYIFRGEKETSFTGPINGLSIVANVYQYTYLPGMLTEKVGVKVMIQAPNSHFIRNEESFDVTPGSSSDLSVKRVLSVQRHNVSNFPQLEIKRLEFPYASNCTPHWNHTKYSPLIPTVPSDTDYEYSRLVSFCTFCVRVRVLIHVGEERYKCMVVMVRGGEGVSGDGIDFKCINETTHYLQDPTKANCGCNLACTDVGYPVTSTTTAWPPENTKDQVHADYKPPESVDDDLLHFRVSFSTLVTESIVQKEIYSTPFDLITNLGGTLSIYLGISLIILAEFVELLLLLIINSCQYALGRYQPRKQQQQQQQQMESQRTVLPLQHTPPSEQVAGKMLADLLYMKNAKEMSKLLALLTAPGPESKTPPYTTNDDLHPHQPHLTPVEEDVNKSLRSYMFDGIFKH